MNATGGALHAGSVLVLAEQDYCYGTGPLTLRVESIGADLASLPRLEWVRIVGHQIHPNGTEEYRDVMARVSALTAALRPETSR